MEEIALGEMGMTEQELWEITPRSLFNKLRGFRKLERDAWERMRIQTFHLLAPYLPKDDTLMPWDIIPLPWDKGLNTLAKVDAKKAAEERENLWNKFDRTDKKMKRNGK